jgi:hypothetical protein
MKWLSNWTSGHTWAGMLAVAGAVDTYLASSQGASVATAMHISGPVLMLAGVVIAACSKQLPGGGS